MASDSNIIKYDGDYFSLVKNLCLITPSIVFNRDGGYVRITRADKSMSIYMNLVVPDEYFTFVGDSIAFVDFPNFCSIKDGFTQPQLIQKDNRIVVNYQSSKINYLLSSPASLGKDPRFTVDMSDPTFSFVLNQELASELSKASGMIRSECATISFSKTTGLISISLSGQNKKSSHSFEKVIKPTTIHKDVNGEVEFSIKSDILPRLPKGMDYIVNVLQTGYVSFNSNIKSMDLMIAVGKIAE